MHTDRRLQGHVFPRPAVELDHTADVPRINPPLGTVSAARTPFAARATGISSLSGLTATSVRTFGLTSPGSATSTVARTALILHQAKGRVGGDEARIHVPPPEINHPGIRLRDLTLTDCGDSTFAEQHVAVCDGRGRLRCESPHW